MGSPAYAWLLVGVTVAVAFVSWRLVERPFLRMKRPPTRQVPVPGVNGAI